MSARKPLDEATRKARQAATHKSWRARNIGSIKERARVKYLENRDKNRAYAIARYHANKAEIFARRREPERQRRENIRRLLLASMGGKCARCTFSDWRALNVDHINGGGKQEAAGRCAVTWYEELTENPDPEKYQLLCANCNAAKKIEGKEFGRDRAFANLTPHGDHRRMMARKRHAKARAAVLSIMGGKCVQCEFSTPSALQIDHVPGGGGHQRKKLNPHNFCRHILTLPDRTGFQLLCANCNTIKRHENREHRKSVLFPELTH